MSTDCKEKEVNVLFLISISKYFAMFSNPYFLFIITTIRVPSISTLIVSHILLQPDFLFGRHEDEYYFLSYHK